MSEIDEGGPDQDPALNLVSKARHISRGEGGLPRIVPDAPQIPGMEYYAEGELEAKNRSEGKGPNGTGIVSNEHLVEENLDEFIAPDDLKQQGIEVVSEKTAKGYLKEQMEEMRQRREAILKEQAAALSEPTPQAPEVPFIDKIRSQARMQTSELDINRANELMTLKHKEQAVLGDNQFMPADEYDQLRQRQVRAEIEATRLNKLRPNVQEEPQEQPGFFRRIARRLRGNQ